MHNDTAKLQIRMDRRLKDSADEVFAGIGIDAATAVRLFFTKVTQTRSIPFRLKAEPEFSPAMEARILTAAEEAKDPANLSGSYSDVSEMFADLRREIEAEK